MTGSRRYLPGELAVMAIDSALVSWRPVDGHPGAADLWNRFASGGSALDALDLLTGVGLDAVPDFAIACIDGDVLRTFVRGGLELLVEGETAGAVTGAGLLTWREDWWRGAKRVSLRRSGVGAPADSQLLPMGVGVLWADMCVWELSTLTAPSVVDHGLLAAPPVVAVPQAAEAVAEPGPGLEVVAEPELEPEPEVVAEPEPEALEIDPASDPARIFLEGRLPSDVPIAAEAPDHSAAGVAPILGPPGETPLTALAGEGPLRVAACLHGHINPDEALRCRVCGSSLGAGPWAWVEHFARGVLRLPDGIAYAIDGPLVLGREPGPPGYVNGARPRWCRVGGPGYEVSRSHVEVRVDGWTVTVVDLDSTNGSVLVAPDGSARPLAPQVPAVMELGWSLVLAESVSLRYEAE